MIRLRTTELSIIIDRMVEEEMAIRSKLIEHVGQRIVTRIQHELHGVIGLRVEIHKLPPQSTAIPERFRL